MQIPNYLDIFAEGKFYLEENAGEMRRILIRARARHSVEELARIMDCSPAMIYYALRGEKRLPICAFLRIADTSARELLYQRCSGISTWGHKSTALPKRYTQELAYLSGAICGDGHLSPKGRIQVTSDSFPYLREHIAPFFMEIFAILPAIHDEKTYYTLHTGSKPANVFLSRVVGIPQGKKKGTLRVPQFIKRHQEFKRAFLQGLFDTDGGITLDRKGKVSILFSSSTIPFLLEVQHMLREFGVFLGGPYYCQEIGKVQRLEVTRKVRCVVS